MFDVAAQRQPCAVGFAVADGVEHGAVQLGDLMAVDAGS
jgi:hypothetical protein